MADTTLGNDDCYAVLLRQAWLDLRRETALDLDAPQQSRHFIANRLRRL
jgi:hypothetical protein